MKNNKFFVLLFFILLLLTFKIFADNSGYSIKKVPYSKYLSSGTLNIVASFDGSYQLDRWKDVLDFAKENGVKFTFFISGVYFIPTNKRKEYIYPGDMTRKGISDIGFGGVSTDVVKRVEYVKQALKDGHDIESHLNGHFNGIHWTQENWRVEFKEFNQLCNFLPRPVEHIRFPLLAMNNEVFPVLAEYGFKSITSIPENDYKKFNRVTINYKGKPYTFVEFPISCGYDNKSKILLMDYNFYIYDKKHHVDIDSAKKEMIKLYLEAADKCYKTKSPFFISHHFADWDHGIYWEAMKEVILTLKKKYKVKFLTVSELTDIVLK